MVDPFIHYWWVRLYCNKLSLLCLVDLSLVDYYSSMYFFVGCDVSWESQRTGGVSWLGEAEILVAWCVHWCWIQFLVHCHSLCTAYTQQLHYILYCTDECCKGLRFNWTKIQRTKPSQYSTLKYKHTYIQYSFIKVK